MKTLLTLILMIMLVSICGASQQSLPTVLIDDINANNRFSKVLQEIYTYDKTFRNPFLDYQQPESSREEPKITIERIWAEIPFTLKGLINYQNRELALVTVGGESRLLKAGDRVGEYQITEILTDSIEIQRRQYLFYMKIGGDLYEG